jgi:glycosyltransferase involved in cell wall biosynthesis
MEKLSVVLITYNEELNIKPCLESVKWADEIILVDQTSVDRTVEIAKNYTDKIFMTAHKGICNPDREFGINKASHEWIFLLEADERIDEKLKKEIIEILNNPSFELYYLPVKTFFIGKWIKSCGWYPSYIPRLFKKGKIKFQSDIHTNGELFTDKIGYLKNDLLHYSYNSVDDWIDKFKRYTTQMAIESFNKGEKINFKNIIIELFFRPAYFFISKFFFLGGYKDGWRGFIISCSSALTVFFSYIKLWELYEKNRKRL